MEGIAAAALVLALYVPARDLACWAIGGNENAASKNPEAKVDEHAHGIFHGKAKVVEVKWDRKGRLRAFKSHSDEGGDLYFNDVHGQARIPLNPREGTKEKRRSLNPFKRTKSKEQINIHDNLDRPFESSPPPYTPYIKTGSSGGKYRV